MANILDTDIKFLPGIGPKRAELLGKELGIFTFRDMLYFFPFRYIDRSKVYTIRELQPTMAYIQVRGKLYPQVPQETLRAAKGSPPSCRTQPGA